MAGASDACNGQVFNVGGDEAVSHRDLVERLIRVAGSGRMRFVEWPPEKRRIDIGSFYADSTKLRETIGWKPGIGLDEGFRRTIEFYRMNLAHYLETPPTVIA